MILLGIACLVAGGCYFWQPVASYKLEPRLDGNEYAKIYSFFKGETQHYDVKFPFHSRILVPFLASLMPVSDAITAFQAVNFIFILGIVISLYFLWQKLKIPFFLQITGFGWLLLHWSGLIRLNAFDPITVDVPVYFFGSLWVLVFVSQKYFHLLWLAPLATLCKEQFPALLMASLALLFYRKDTLFQSRQPLIMISLSLVLSLLCKATINSYFPAVTSGNSVNTLWQCMIITINHPFRIVRWLVAFFMAYGFFILPVIKELYKKTDEISILAGICLVVSFLGGGDFTRLTFLGFPFIMTAIWRAFGKIPLFETIVIVLFSVPFMRLFWQIPDPGKEWHYFTTWYPEYASPEIVIGWGLYITIVCTGWLVYLKRKPFK